MAAAAEIEAVEIEGPAVIRLSSSQTLRIRELKDQVLYLVEQNGVVLVAGAAGCGKTTQLPQILCDEGDWAQEGRSIAIVEPRRIAAESAAARIAEERGVALPSDDVAILTGGGRGQTPGLPPAKMCFVTAETFIRREIGADPLLHRYSVIMVDEVHERTLYTDMLLGMLKLIRSKRPDLRVVVASATLDIALFKEFFERREPGDAVSAKRRRSRWDMDKDVEGEYNESKGEACPIADNVTGVLVCEGAPFDVRIYYRDDPVGDIIAETSRVVIRCHSMATDEGGSSHGVVGMTGDILAFLPTPDAVDAAATQIEQYLENQSKLKDQKHRLAVSRLYTGTSLAELQAIFASERSSQHVQRAIISTPQAAEASITLPSVSVVVDCGLSTVRAYEPDKKTVTYCTEVVVLPEDYRTRPGVCFRLFTQDSLLDGTLASSPVPEAARSALAPAVLVLLSLGVRRILKFDWPTAPPSVLVADALQELVALGALNRETGELSNPLGYRISLLPLNDPRAARRTRTVLCAAEFGAGKFAPFLGALLDLPSVFMPPISMTTLRESDTKKVEEGRQIFGVHEGDVLSALNALQAYARTGKFVWADVQGSKDQVTKLRKRFANKYRLRHGVLLAALFLGNEISSMAKKVGVVFNPPGQQPSRSASEVGRSVRRAIAAGFFLNAARAISGPGAGDRSGETVYETLRGRQKATIDKSSVLYMREPAPPLVLYSECNFQAAQETGYLKTITPVEQEWLLELAPHVYSTMGAHGIVDVKDAVE